MEEIAGAEAFPVVVAIKGNVALDSVLHSILFPCPTG